MRPLHWRHEGRLRARGSRRPRSVRRPALPPCDSSPSGRGEEPGREEPGRPAGGSAGGGAALLRSTCSAPPAAFRPPPLPRRHRPPLPRMPPISLLRLCHRASGCRSGPAGPRAPGDAAGGQVPPPSKSRSHAAVHGAAAVSASPAGRAAARSNHPSSAPHRRPLTLPPPSPRYTLHPAPSPPAAPPRSRAAPRRRAAATATLHRMPRPLLRVPSTPAASHCVRRGDASATAAVCARAACTSRRFRSTAAGPAGRGEGGGGEAELLRAGPSSASPPAETPAAPPPRAPRASPRAPPPPRTALSWPPAGRRG
jgi:hypothetical protein